MSYSIEPLYLFLLSTTTFALLPKASPTVPHHPSYEPSHTVPYRLPPPQAHPYGPYSNYQSCPQNHPSQQRPLPLTPLLDHAVALVPKAHPAVLRAPAQAREVLVQELLDVLAEQVQRRGDARAHLEVVM